jgi:hypothetical protein
MNYTKPEIAVLGDAARVIEQTGAKVIVHHIDPPKNNFNPPPMIWMSNLRNNPTKVPSCPRIPYSFRLSH